MGNKYAYYIVELSLDDVCNRSIAYWERNRGRIQDYTSSQNQLYREIVIMRGASMVSWGEQYIMRLGSNLGELRTYVSIEVSLSFGYGMAWNTPKKFVKRWAREMGIEPMNLVRTLDPEFVNFFNSVQNIQIPITPTIALEQLRCPECGSGQIRGARFCTNCGAQLPP